MQVSLSDFACDLDLIVSSSSELQSDRISAVFRQDAEAIEVLLRQDIELGAEPGRPVPSPVDLSVGDSCCSPEPFDTDDGDALVPLKPAQQVTTHDCSTPPPSPPRVPSPESREHCSLGAGPQRTCNKLLSS